jgi:hypothetical protein
MRRLFARTLQRAVTREVLWNGNREPLSNFVSVDPEKSVFVWSWITYEGLSRRYSTAMTDPAWSHLRFVRLRSNAEARRWLESIDP